MSSTALETLRLLERRLARLEFYLGNDDASAESGEPDAAVDSVSSRMAKLESRFADICSKHPLAKELLQLHSRLPEVYTETTASPSSPDRLQIVLSSAPTYASAVSDLNALHEYPVPDTRSFASLVALRSRLLRARATQEAQRLQVAELTQRSASVLTQWYQSKVLAEGEQWSEWEERLAKAEQTVRRMESSATREQMEV